MQPFISTQVSEGYTQIFNELCIKGIVHLCTSHADDGDFILESALNADVCVCGHGCSSEISLLSVPGLDSLLVFPDTVHNLVTPTEETRGSETVNNNDCEQ